MSTYYQQWKAKASGYVEHYFTDVTVHDKRLLRNIDCRFIGAMRPTGTNMIVLDGEPRSDVNIRGVEVFTFEPNHRFYFGSSGRVTKIAKGEAMDIWREYKAQLTRQRKQS